MQLSRKDPPEGGQSPARGERAASSARRNVSFSSCKNDRVFTDIQTYGHTDEKGAAEAKQKDMDE